MLMYKVPGTTFYEVILYTVNDLQLYQITDSIKILNTITTTKILYKYFR